MEIIFLLAMGIILVILNINALKKDNKSFKDTLNQYNNDELQELYNYIDETIAKNNSTVKELREEIALLKEQVNYKKEEKEILNEIEVIKDEEFEKKTDNGLNIDKVKKLIDKGLSIEEIAEDLSMGKGEVLLVKELYLK